MLTPVTFYSMRTHLEPKVPRDAFSCPAILSPRSSSSSFPPDPIGNTPAPVRAPLSQSLSNKHINSFNPPDSDEYANESHPKHLSVSLSNTLNLVLLLNSIAVGGTLGGVHQLISQAFGHGLDVAESSFTSLHLKHRYRTYTSGQKSQSEAHTAEGRHIHSLTTDNTGSTDTGGVFTRTGVGNGISKNLDGVLVGHEVDDVESLLNDLHGVHLLTGVTTMEHQAVGETLNKRALQNQRPPQELT